MSVYEEIYKKHGLSPTQQEILKLVGNQKRILEIGSSTGYMTKCFLDNLCVVDVVEKNKQSFKKIPNGVRLKLEFNIENSEIKTYLAKDYDFIILADVLEHLAEPEKTLRTLYKIAGKKTYLLISLPNIANWIIRKQLFLKGDFEYHESGPLDKTHLHFYTVKTLPKLLLENGWKVEKILGTITRLPFQESLCKIPILGIIFKKIIFPNIAEKYKNLSYYHFLTIAIKR